MLTKVTIRVAGEEQLVRGFEMTAREAGDLTGPLRQVGDHLLEQVGQQFAEEGAHGGAGWQPLNRAYEAWKDANAPAGPGMPILVFSGRMRAAALAKSTITVTPRRLVYEVGSGDLGPGEPDRGELALMHHEGKGSLPARRIVELNTEARRQVDRLFVDWLNGIRRGAFGPPIL